MGIGGSEENGYYQIDCNSIKLFNTDTEIRISPIGISSVDDEYTSLFNIDSTAIILGPANNPNVKISEEGVTFKGKTNSDIPTANGSFIDISNYATRDFVTVGLSAKQNKITVNAVDVTDIETADVTKLRTIVTNLIDALSSSGLINATDGVEQSQVLMKA